MIRVLCLFLFALAFFCFSDQLTIVEAQSEDCPPGIEGDWQAVAAGIYIEYGNVIQVRGDMQRASMLQALRRCLDNQERPPDYDEAYRLLRNAIDLTVDSIISAQIGESEDSDRFLAEANDQYSEAALLISGVIPNPSQDAVGTITSPQEGMAVPETTQVTGTYNTAVLDDNHHLWLLVITPDSLVYPQASHGCPGGQRESIPFSAIDNTWTMTIRLGGPPDVGKSFRLVLALVDEAGNTFLNEKYDGWCETMSFPGLSQDEVFRADFEVAVEQTVNVIRE
jgi:hypothetical protein